MFRLVYTALVLLAAPIVLAATALRGLRAPAYRDRLGERLGYTQTRFPAPPIWVHAVSVGEVQAAAPLVRELQKRRPEQPILLTTATPTGAQRVRSLFGDSVRHVYLPYDTPGAVRRFLQRTRPTLAVIMEREVWPNLFAACALRNVPILIASARISANSAERHRKLARLFAPALRRNVIVAAQTESDALRYRAIGAPADAVHVTGNVKFDVEISAAVKEAGAQLRSEIGARPVWCAGSTHEGEEAAMLDAHARVCAAHHDALLVLVPRHPQRFAEVADLLRRREIRFVTRSSQRPVGDATVLLADTLGELTMLYAASDVAFVAGSLAPIGGHNLLEPAVLAKPIIVGPHNFNAPDIAELFLTRGAALQVSSADELAAALVALFRDSARREKIGALGQTIVAENCGAVARVLELIDALEAKSAPVRVNA